ncbi:Thioredoxin-like superfamily [Babesia duncani]|uniref:Thioredoxin-like superfamily n=1 Tax=Babesia duncani TaxID=323732 RepID=A0AAD9UPD8_9APIC|nr:Thioredoxin-like superfamily [Babesia duncani]
MVMGKFVLKEFGHLFPRFTQGSKIHRFMTSLQFPGLTKSVNRHSLIDRRYIGTLEETCSRLSKLENPISIPNLENIKTPKNFEEYHAIVYGPRADETVVFADDLVITFFLAKQSTAAISILPLIETLAKEYPTNRFLVVDADLVPRAAYDADIQQFPSVLVSYGGDLFRDLIQGSTGYPLGWRAAPRWDATTIQSDVACILPETFYKSIKNSVDTFYRKHDGKSISSIKTKAGTHSYTHGIDTDNLNVKRVGWPTE